MPKNETPDLETYKTDLAWVTDYFQYNADTIRDDRTIRLAAATFVRMTWAVREVRRLNGMDALDAADRTRFLKTEKRLQTITADYAAAIKGGEFIKIGAKVWTVARFLLRCVRTVYDYVLEAEELAQAHLGANLPAKHQERAELRLEDDITDAEVAVEPPPRERADPQRPNTGTRAGHLAREADADDLPRYDQPVG